MDSKMKPVAWGRGGKEPLYSADQVKELTDALAEARKVIEFYANPENHKNHTASVQRARIGRDITVYTSLAGRAPAGCALSDVQCDFGDIARAWLSANPAKGGE